MERPLRGTNTYIETLGSIEPSVQDWARAEGNSSWVEVVQQKLWSSLARGWRWHLAAFRLALQGRLAIILSLLLSIILIQDTGGCGKFRSF